MKAIFKKFEHSAQNMTKKYMVQHIQPCMKSMCNVLNSRACAGYHLVMIKVKTLFVSQHSFAYFPLVLYLLFFKMSRRT